MSAPPNLPLPKEILRKRTGKIVKDNHGVIWTEVIEIEELEHKTAPSGSWDVCPN